MSSSAPRPSVCSEENRSATSNRGAGRPQLASIRARAWKKRFLVSKKNRTSGSEPELPSPLPDAMAGLPGRMGWSSPISFRAQTLSGSRLFPRLEPVPTSPGGRPAGSAARSFNGARQRSTANITSGQMKSSANTRPCTMSACSACSRKRPITFGSAIGTSMHHRSRRSTAWIRSAGLAISPSRLLIRILFLASFTSPWRATIPMTDSLPQPHGGRCTRLRGRLAPAIR